MKVYVISKNGIPICGYTSLKSASECIDIPYMKVRGMLISGNRVVSGDLRLTMVVIEKICGRGKKF